MPGTSKTVAPVSADSVSVGSEPVASKGVKVTAPAEATTK